MLETKKPSGLWLEPLGFVYEKRASHDLYKRKEKERNYDTWQKINLSLVLLH